MDLFYCPTCSRVYALVSDQTYLCSRQHLPSALADGRRHRLTVTEKIESDRSPWSIPEFTEEVELQQEGFIENWVESCKYPQDENKDDMTRHEAANRIGGRHLGREQVVSKFKPFVLQKMGSSS